MGYSMGGRAALRFALNCPERLAALVLVSTSPGITDPDLRSQRVAADAMLADKIEKNGVDAFVDEWEKQPLWESQRSLPEVVRDVLRKHRLSNRPDGLANSLLGAGAGADAPVHDRLEEIGMQTLVVAGALDSRYVELAALLATSIPNASAFIVPDAGHAVHVERPDALTDATISFLRGVPSSGDRWL
jgi:2-succinyl-6-hydroxy-2,4-cyclohexadiene-1-carboxylate synthase